jgi:hypothetical protein
MVNSKEEEADGPKKVAVGCQGGGMQNELMGNLSLHKELDFIVKVNEWSEHY